jgi:long-chain acyl-CoA synthetase
MQTREVQGRTDGARISTLNKTDKLFSYYYEDAMTLHELFIKARKLSDDGDYLGWKTSPSTPFKWLKYSQVHEIAEQIGSAFVHFGLEPAKDTLIGIFAKNRPEWVMTANACEAYNFVSVPLYDTLGDEAINFILLQTELKIVVCDDSSKAMHLMNSSSSLKHIVVIENITDEAHAKAEQCGIQILTLEQVKEIGKKNRKDFVPPKPDDLATICYTSGTTGKPKGALIDHKSFVAIASSMLTYVERSGMMDREQDRYLSYLPLAHMFERISQATVVGMGGKIGFYQGDIKKLVDDMKELKPTIFCTVPRLLNRIYSKINDNLEKASPIKRAIFKYSFAQKEKEVLTGVVRSDSIYDFAFKQIRESLGGCVKILISGSAPISAEVLHFMRVCAGCFVMEGYGATETGGAASVQIPGETTVGNVGPPFMCTMYKLTDVPEMNLVAKRDNRGEICVYGTNVFKGYYKDEEKTKEALTDDGWYKTGDIGSWESNGTLKIVDRVKNIFKLQQGEYIAPEKIENIYVRSKYVAQAFIYGNSLKSTLVGVVVPEEPVVFEWAKEHGLEADMTLLCKNTELKDTILKDLQAQGKLGGLKGFEQVKNIHLHNDLFSVENGLLTPTMKAKRPQLTELFKSELDEMYKNLD